MISIGLEGFPITVKSNKQKVVSTSSCESELIGLHDLLDLLMWCREIMKFMGHPQNPTVIYVDATSTIKQAHMGRPAQNTKRWIDIKYFWVTELIKLGLVIVQHLDRANMIADPYASIRVGADFRRGRDALGIYDHPSEGHSESKEKLKLTPEYIGNSKRQRT